MKNWKTTAAGISVALVAALLSLGYITEEQATAIGLLLTAIGFGYSKDKNVTGGTTKQ